MAWLGDLDLASEINVQDSENMKEKSCEKPDDFASEIMCFKSSCVVKGHSTNSTYEDLLDTLSTVQSAKLFNNIFFGTEGGFLQQHSTC